MWSLQAKHAVNPALEERYARQGTAYRRARQLYAAGYAITAVQFSIDRPPQILAVYRFDGIRFQCIARLPD